MGNTWDLCWIRFRVARKGCKKKTLLLDYFKRCLVLSYRPTLTMPLTSLFFFPLHLPPTHTHVCWIVKVSSINPALRYFSHTTKHVDFSSVDFTGSEVPQPREEEVDLTLLKNDSGVESALLYAKTCSKYIKDLLAWMEKRLAMGETTDSLLGWKQWIFPERKCCQYKSTPSALQKADK